MSASSHSYRTAFILFPHSLLSFPLSLSGQSLLSHTTIDITRIDHTRCPYRYPRIPSRLPQRMPLICEPDHRYHLASYALVCA
ncbi:hypothetical protein DFH07DRAFT_843332 [Mycena maculata]|uniref:Uncharacterized protein n=1 Tax=Mycena maculata TaxID=230809 RepID=A0AAD7I727_9AGAR|nr:hypothetical protein DFH07DRAFT_843332 [Mycena maculata]